MGIQTRPPRGKDGRARSLYNTIFIIVERLAKPVTAGDETGGNLLGKLEHVDDGVVGALAAV